MQIVHIVIQVRQKEGKNFNNIISKAIDIWGSRSLNERPFQIAIGGAGESTIHPDWVEFVKCVKDMEIMPNYTTNGMHLSNEIIRATEDYCGVAISWHPHISKTFDKAVLKLSEISNKIKLNTHIILGDRESFEDLKRIYYNYYDKFDYFVILPYQAVGRGKDIEVEEIWNETFKWIETVDTNKFAFGALFYEWLLKKNVNLDIDIYEPEIYSGYRIFDNSYRDLRNSSYDLKIKKNRKKMKMKKNII